MDKDILDKQLRQLTYNAMIDAKGRWKSRTEVDKDHGNFIWFMGTGGNPEATIRQYPATAGFVIGLGETLIYVDPGPGAAVKASEAGLDLGQLDGIYISHGHVDHYAGIEPIIEGMCWAMSARRGVLMAPKSVFDEGLVSAFHRGLTNKHFYKGGPYVKELHSKEEVTVGQVKITPIPAYHAAENYGFIMEVPGLRLGYTSDTNYITSFLTPDGVREYGRWGAVMDLLEIKSYREDIKAVFSNVDILIANVTSHNSLMHRHLTGLGLAHLLTDSKVKSCIITHFGHSCLSPVDLRDKIAEYISAASGIKTMVAKDLKRFSLEEYL